jgi:hypothetical protein
MAQSTAGAERAAIDAALRRLDRFAHLFDRAVRIPGTRWRVGLDGLLGFFPGLGDGLTTLIALYPLIEAWRLGAPPALLARMLANIGIDGVVGSVPVAGDLFDIAFKANVRNVALLRDHLARR